MGRSLPRRSTFAADSRACSRSIWETSFRGRGGHPSLDIPPEAWLEAYENLGACQRRLEDAVREKGLWHPLYEAAHECLVWRIWCDKALFPRFQIPFDLWIDYVYWLSKELHVARAEICGMPWYETLMLIDKMIAENEKQKDGSGEQGEAYRRQMEGMRSSMGFDSMQKSLSDSMSGFGALNGGFTMPKIDFPPIGG